MKHVSRIWPVLLAAALSASLQGQTTPTPPPADPPPAPSPWSAGGIDFSGLIDGYYSINTNHPASRTNNLRYYDARANQLSLNLAKFTAEKSADPVGFKLDLGFGRGADLFNSFEPIAENRNITRNILQAYLSVKPPKAGGLQFDFGKFATSAGAELTETHLNWNYSRGFLYANGPFYHFGARMSKPVTSNWTAGVQLTNGWNNIEDNNSGKTVGLTSALTGKKASLFNTYYVGPEKTDSNEGYRHFFDTVLTLAPSEKANFYINYDYGVDKAGAGADRQPFWGLGMAGHFVANSWFSVSPRYEVYDDGGGLITGKVQRLQSFTFTAEAKMAKGFLTRAEYRRDSSNQAYFDRGNEAGSAKNQNTFLVGFVVYFGPK
ncbi:MAG: porin [Bryobacterales bacterium]|nr:porin [Bryobacterales bacterium]